MQISVVIPAYNATRYLAATVESVLAQTFSDWELLIVDDGSTDGTLAQIQEWATRDARIRCLHQENAGVSTARNRGFSEATADYILFIDSDDLLEADALQTLLAALDAYPESPAVHGQACYIDAEGRLDRPGELEQYSRNRYAVKGRKLMPLPLDSPTTFEAEVYMDYISTGTVLVRRSAIERAGLFDPEIHFFEDWDFYLRICLIGGMIFVNKTVLRVRRHQTNVSNNIPELLKGEKQVRRKLLIALAEDSERREIVLLGKYYKQRAYVVDRVKRAMQCLNERQFVQATSHLFHASKAGIGILRSGRLSTVKQSR